MMNLIERAPLGSKPFLTIDIETEKVAGEFRWRSGETNSRRWKPYVIGVGFSTDNRTEFYIFENHDEKELMEEAGETLVCLSGNTNNVVYMNSRNRFDEMVLAGRFINARRPLAKRCGPWPILETDPKLIWKRIEDFRSLYDRSDETFSWREAAKLSRAGDPVIAKHCYRDLVENLCALNRVTKLNRELGRLQ